MFEEKEGLRALTRLPSKEVKSLAYSILTAATLMAA